MAQSSLTVRLVRLGVDSQSAEDVCRFAASQQEALQFLGRDENGHVTAHINKWREYFCEKNQRFYYCNDAIGYNSWDAPLCFHFREWQMDSQLYSIPIEQAANIYLALDGLLSTYPPRVAFQAFEVLAKLVGNVADCNNSVERFRSVKLSNPRFKAAVGDVPGALSLCALLGWQRSGDVLALWEGAPLAPLRAAASRLRSLAAHKGHSGSATAVNPDKDGGGGGRPASRFYGSPGFTYQEQIWHCNECDHPINDGSERLWSGRWDAPHGEYRYHCSTCSGEGTSYNLCQSCWDLFQQQQQAAGSTAGGGRSSQLHDSRHAFEHVGPRMTRHNDYYSSGGAEGGEGGSNPWGARRGAGGAYGRALQRLGQRYGVHNWG